MKKQSKHTVTQGSDPSVPLLPVKRPNTYRKNGLRMRFSAQNTAFIDIYIYICNLKCKLYLHENNDIYDKGYFQSDQFSYAFIQHAPALRQCGPLHPYPNLPPRPSSLRSAPCNCAGDTGNMYAPFHFGTKCHNEWQLLSHAQ